ncbi:MAG: hypothetical protein PHD41_09355 [Methanosarcinaceae archaeon]|nr:hypothetical protein [Methanosarcinaceae archaeon]MDD4748655.1 hypothetical protein [Methanosarcinaceae archaeon]
MVQDLCMFSGWDEDTEIVWFKISYPREKGNLAAILNFLEEHGVDIKIGHIDNTETEAEGKYSIFSKIKKEVDLEKLAQEMKAFGPVKEIEYGISKYKMIYAVDFTMNVIGVRAIIARAKTLADVIKTFYDNAPHAEGLLIQSGLKGGIEAAKYFKSIMAIDLKNAPDMIAELYRAVGWGLLDIKCDCESMTGRVIVKDSFIADVWGEADQPVCAFMSGYLAGYFTEVAGRTIQVREVSCKAAGHEVCEHIISPAPDSAKLEHLMRGERA